MKGRIELNFDLTYRLNEQRLPDIGVEYGKLWRFASVLKGIGLSVEGWHPAAPTEKESLLINAFDRDEPTTAAIARNAAQRLF